MSSILVERCPETRLCSIVKGSTSKVDLLPDEADAVVTAAGDGDRIREIIAECDPAFAKGLTDADLAEISSQLV